MEQPDCVRMKNCFYAKESEVEKVKSKSTSTGCAWWTSFVMPTCNDVYMSIRKDYAVQKK